MRVLGHNGAWTGDWLGAPQINHTQSPSKPTSLSLLLTHILGCEWVALGLDSLGPAWAVSKGHGSDVEGCDGDGQGSPPLSSQGGHLRGVAAGSQASWEVLFSRPSPAWLLIAHCSLGYPLNFLPWLFPASPLLFFNLV